MAVRGSVTNSDLTNEHLLEELIALREEISWANFLSVHPSVISTGFITELTDRVRELVRVDVQIALRASDISLLISSKLNDTESTARSLRARANALYATGDHAAAIDFHEQAAHLFDSLGLTNELARTLSSSIQPMLLIGEYDRAFAAAERAREIFVEEKNVWRLARLQINVGNIFYRQDRFAEALECYQQALRDLPVDKDPEGIAAVLSNIATCQISLNSFPKALEAYKQARDFCTKHDMPLLVSQADYNIAYLYYLRGEYTTAIEMLRAARDSAEAIGDAYHYSLCNLDLSELYLELNLSDEAWELSQQGYEGFQKLGMGYETAKCLAFSAMAASQIGRAFEAIKLFTEAREIFVRENNRAWPSLIDLYRALVYFNEGRYFEAKRLCMEVIKPFGTLNLVSKFILAQLLLARIALATDDLDEASQRVTEAMEKVKQIGAPVLTYQCHLLAGDIYLASGDADEAYQSYQIARDDLETLRSSLRGEELKIAFIKNRLVVYEHLVEICMNRKTPGTTEEAFHYVEQAKSRSLMDWFVRPAPVLSEVSGQSELVRRIRETREELNWYYNLIERAQFQPEQRSPERISELEKQAREHETELLHMLQEATPTDAASAGLQMPSYLHFDDIRAALSPDTQLVEYFLLRDRILACIVGRERLEIVPISLGSRVSGILRLLQLQTSNLRKNSQYLETSRDSLFETTQSYLGALYDELIRPVVALLQANHLVFVPHGLLHYVPFHALFDGKEHVIDRHTVSYAPSASIYALCETRTVNSGKSALVFGIPDSQAPAILDEVQALRGVLDDAEVFIGKNATEHVLRTRGPASHIIHIATHGRFRQDNPMFSAIRLGDSFLSLFDLYHLHLPVELITLSGCSTGLSGVSGGNELVGLARGLLHAGAQSLVLSLWDVHDESTAKFMTAFYKCLRQGKTKAAAMQAAMIGLRSHYPHAYQWAPFVLVGKS